MVLTSEDMILLSQIKKELSKMSVDEIKQVGEGLIRSGVSSSAMMTEAGENIRQKYSDMFNKDIVNIALENLKSAEQKRQFDVTTALQKAQFNASERLAREQFEYNKRMAEEAKAEAKSAEKKAKRNWWKPWLGTAAGIATGGFLTPLATAGSSFLQKAGSKFFGLNKSEKETEYNPKYVDGRNILSLYKNWWEK